MIAGFGLKGSRFLWAGFILLAVIPAGGQAAPVISKIDPPNWWIGLPNPMVMLTGRNLENAKVSVNAPGVHVVRTSQGKTGHYLFTWLEVEKSAASGPISLVVTNGTGEHRVDWRLDQRDPEAMRSHGNEGFNGFGPDDVIYLIMPDRFADGDPENNFPATGAYDRSQPRAYHGGDLRGIEQHLPYLKDLGVTTIWITPICNNDSQTGRDYHGYGAVDLYAVEEHFGTVAEYRSLVQAAHRQGLKVILDIVPNHIGPASPWVDDPPTDHWIHGTRDKHLVADAAFQHLTDPHSSPRKWRNIVEGWFAGVLPDMGTDDPLTSQYLRQNALWWAETGALDGFRLDTFPYVDRPFWRDFHSAVHSTYPRFRTVGEVSGSDPAVAAYFVGGKTTAGIDTGVDTVFDFTFCSALHRVILHDAPATLLKEVFERDRLFPHPEWLVTFLGNHDSGRFMGDAGASVQKLKLAFSLLLTVRGIPQIYAGDEIGMPGGDDPDNRRDFPGGFPGDRRNAFTEIGRTAEEQDVFAHVQKLLLLRRQHAALRRGRYVHVFSDDATFAYLRDFQGSDKGPTRERSERLLVFMNNADRARTLEVDIRDSALSQTTRLARLWADNEAALIAGRHISVQLPPRSLSIYAAK